MFFTTVPNIYWSTVYSPFKECYETMSVIPAPTLLWERKGRCGAPVQVLVSYILQLNNQLSLQATVNYLLILVVGLAGARRSKQFDMHINFVSAIYSFYKSMLPALSNHGK